MKDQTQALKPGYYLEWDDVTWNYPETMGGRKMPKGLLNKKPYESIEQARASAYRRLWPYFPNVMWWGAISVYKVDARGKKVCIGGVVGDQNYMWEGRTELFWVPEGAGESDIVHGVSSSGKLNRETYRLT